MKALLIAGINLRRTMREPTSIFFMFIFPMVLILVIGVSFGGAFKPRVGLVNEGEGGFAAGLAADLRAAAALDVRTVESPDDLIRAVERGELEAGLEIPGTYDDALAGDRPVPLRYVVRPDRQSQQIGSIVSAIVAKQSARFRIARFVRDETGAPFDASLRIGDQVVSQVPKVEVSATTVGTSLFPADLGRFDLGASGQLVLFIFITSLTAAAALIETRRLGLSRRMLSTPTRGRTVVVGEALSRVAIAGIQGVFIMLGTTLLFDVSWGDPVAAVLLMLAFALFAGGAGMLLGTAARSTEQSIAIGVLLGVGFGALGGSMLPLEFFSPTMKTIAHFTPHAWAIEGFNDLVLRGAGLVEILTPIAVLLGGAAVLFATAAWQLRRSIAR